MLLIRRHHPVSTASILTDSIGEKTPSTSIVTCKLVLIVYLMSVVSYIDLKMHTGATVIKHDSETVPVDGCRNGRYGCLNRTINYQVPTRQIVALSRQSHGCHQKLEFEVRAYTSYY
jgi:hypothetical protein